MIFAGRQFTTTIIKDTLLYTVLRARHLFQSGNLKHISGKILFQEISNKLKPWVIYNPTCYFEIVI
jgi:hypothetical protein